MSKPELHYSIPEPTLNAPSVEQETPDTESLFKKGLAEFRKGNISGAIESLSDVVDVDPDHHKAWNALGVAFSTENNYSEADICFQNACTLDPGNEKYQKNLEKNASHMKKPGFVGTYLQPLLNKFPKQFRNIPPHYLTIGGGIILVIIIIIAILASGILSPPLSQSAGPVTISGAMADNTITLTNRGGPGSEQISAFSWTVDGIEVPPGAGTTLNTDSWATASVNASSLNGVNLSDETTVTVTAKYKDDSEGQVATITFIPVIQYIEKDCPVPQKKAYIPLYNPGALLLEESSGMYWLVQEKTPDEEYLLVRAIRNPGDQYSIREEQTITKPMEEVDKSVRHVKDIPLGSGSTAGSTLEAFPRKFEDGTLVWRTKVPEEQLSEVMYVQGFDPAADAYLAYMIYRHYNGEWGYRLVTTPERYPRVAFEEQYPAIISRVATNLITIGADSLPKSVSPYSPGDILTTGRGAEETRIIILGYDPVTMTYKFQEVKPNYSGGWYRTGEIRLEKASIIHQQFPLLETDVDPDTIPQA